MCMVCAASQSFNYYCDTAVESSEITAVEHESTFNNTTKPSKDWDEAALQLGLWNARWNDGGTNLYESPATVSWSFGAMEIPEDSIVRVAGQQLSMTLTAISYIEDVANIDFTRVGSGTSGNAVYSDSADLLIGAIDGYGGGVGGWNGIEATTGADYEITSGYALIGNTADFSTEYGYGMLLTLHEIMHALGIKHPGDYNGSGAVSYAADAEYYQDSEQYTVMSYWDETNTSANFYNAANGIDYNSTNLMLHDIAILQYLYGANMSTRLGDTVYGFNSNTGDASWTISNADDNIVAAVWDAGGNDTLDVSGYSQDAEIDLREEAFSSFGGLTYNFSIARGTVIENATGGSGDDYLIGNDAVNVLSGGDGDDRIVGLGGADILSGGKGDDRIEYDAEDDWAGGAVTGGEGIDVLYFTVTWMALDLAANGFEQSALYLVDTLNEIWHEYVELYDINHRQINEYYFFDDGTYQIKEFDVDFAETWATRTTVYAADDSIISSSTEDDAAAVADTNNITEEDATSSGNVTSNDSGVGIVVNMVNRDGEAPENVTNVAATSVDGLYGTLEINSDGSYVYHLDNTNPGVDALNDGQSLEDVFEYQIIDAIGGISSSSLTITVDGYTDPVSAPIGVPDTATALEDSTAVGPDASGNVLGNDLGDALLVTGVNGQSLAASGQTIIAGTYGTLIIAADGAWTYEVDNSNLNVDGLNDGESLLETFFTEIANAGGVAISSLQITINGADDINVVNGTDIGELLFGTAGAEIINGLGGDDTIDGLAGDDVINAGDGNDVVVYDPNDTQSNIFGGAGVDKLLITDMAAPTGFDLVAQGFEGAERLVNDLDGNRDWTTVVETYDESWQLTLSLVTNDDGTTRSVEYNYYPGSTWTERTTDRNTSDAPTFEALKFADGNTRWLNLDVENSESWNILLREFDANNNTIFQQFDYDDGTKLWLNEDFDGSQPWNSLRREFDANNNVTFQQFINDDGTKLWINEDTTNQHAWDSMRREFDVNGEIFFQQFVFDDGTKTWLNTDVGDVQDWTSLERLFDDNGDLYKQNAVLDDSQGRILTLYDVGNTETWDQWVRQFDDNGVLVQEDFV